MPHLWSNKSFDFLAKRRFTGLFSLQFDGSPIMHSDGFDDYWHKSKNKKAPDYKYCNFINKHTVLFLFTEAWGNSIKTHFQVEKKINSMI